MAKFIVRAQIHPDMETGPGEPDPGMEASEMGKMPKKGVAVAMNKPAQFTLPKSGGKPGGKKKPPSKKGPGDGYKY